MLQMRAGGDRLLGAVQPMPSQKDATAKVAKRVPAVEAGRSGTTPEIVPYPHQLEGVELIQKFKGRCGLFDDPGTGKSATTIWWAQKYLSEGTVVVVCPAILKENWRREFWTHGRIRAQVLHGRTPPRRLPPCTDGAYVINYDILGGAEDGKAWWKLLRTAGVGLVVLDEFRLKIMSRATKSTKAVRRLCKGVPHVIGLDGTGGMNSGPAQMWPFLNICRPSVFPTWRPFGMKFCAPKFKPWGTEFKGASNTGELHSLLKSTLLVRRTKQEVMKDLPPKVHTILPLALPRKAVAEYRDAESTFAQWLIKTAGWAKARASLKAQELTKWAHLRQLVARLKADLVTEYVRTFLDTTNEKLLVFGIGVKALERLHGRFPGSVLINGKTKPTDRQLFVDRFNRDRRCRLFFGNVVAAGTGWSCTSASTVLFAELDWVPATHVQAVDRVEGISRGRPGAHAHAIYAVCQGTLEERLCKLIQARQRVLREILDGRADADLPVFDELRRELLARHKGEA